MTRRRCFLALLPLLSWMSASSAGAQAPVVHGNVLVPESSVPLAADRGLNAHTNHLILLRQNPGTPFGGLGPGGGMTPGQIRSFYNQPSTGGAGAIAIVDAYNYPTALNDFNVFAAQFGLPREPSTQATASTNTIFQVVYATGSQPKNNGSWSQEAALDIEWAHAMAPSAKIFLVEAASNSFSNLIAAVDVASKLPGVAEVSMSWGGSEFSSETSNDSHFQVNGVVYFGASGDTGGAVIYPSASPYVVACGGTSVATDSGGNFVNETGWSGSGGGPSAYEPKPSYQVGVAQTPASTRGVPDIAADADPNTGVSVYDSTSYRGLSGWLVFGGTSVATPLCAGIANVSGSRYSSSYQALTSIYNLAVTSPGVDFRDITSGTAGSFSCLIGWDFVSGNGSPLGTVGL